MARKENAKKLWSKRSFLRWLVASLSFFPVHLILCKFLVPTSAIAQERPPAAPGSGGVQSNEKIVFDKEILDRADELSKKWDANAMKNNRYLTPEQKKQQREEVEKVLRNIVETKGYTIPPPKNFRFIN